MDKETTKLTLLCGTTVTFTYNDGSNQLLMLAPKHFKRQDPFISLTFQDTQTLRNLGGLSALLNVANETTQNLTAVQKELLLWHHKLAHANMQHVQTLLCEPITKGYSQMIKPKEQKAFHCCQRLCAACQLTKQSCQGSGSHSAVPSPDHLNVLRQGNLLPGSDVSTNQYMLALHGRLLHTKGKESKSKKYTGGTLFVDHLLMVICHSHQISLCISETLKAKHKFKRWASKHGMTIKKYHPTMHQFERSIMCKIAPTKAKI
jgi:hypothetical protein